MLKPGKLYTLYDMGSWPSSRLNICYGIYTGKNVKYRDLYEFYYSVKLGDKIVYEFLIGTRLQWAFDENIGPELI